MRLVSLILQYNPDICINKSHIFFLAAVAWWLRSWCEPKSATYVTPTTWRCIIRPESEKQQKYPCFCFATPHWKHGEQTGKQISAYGSLSFSLRNERTFGLGKCRSQSWDLQRFTYCRLTDAWAKTAAKHGCRNADLTDWRVWLRNSFRCLFFSFKTAFCFHRFLPRHNPLVSVTGGPG